ncbi:MAG: YidH family protein [Sphingomonas sp.]|uniref:YidH family protein n=1 Tax=Sphingomonas sp. TaxID=28214 RepID=UPI003F819126
MADPQIQARRTQEKIKQSAVALKESATQQLDSADRRTELAADRTIFAAERTYAAWVRTGLAALASGIGARALLDGIVTAWLIRSTGAMLELFAGFCFVAAVWREMWPSVQPPKPRARRMPAALLIAINGFLVLVTLAAFVGVVAAR